MVIEKKVEAKIIFVFLGKFEMFMWNREELKLHPTSKEAMQLPLGCSVEHFPFSLI